MFPIWFLPPNKLEKFPQTPNYTPALYKHSVVKFSFFSVSSPTPFIFFFFKCPCLSSVLSCLAWTQPSHLAHSTAHICCCSISAVQERRGVVKPKDWKSWERPWVQPGRGWCSQLWGLWAFPPLSYSTLSLGSSVLPLLWLGTLLWRLLRTMACPLFLCQGVCCFTILV